MLYRIIRSSSGIGDIITSLLAYLLSIYFAIVLHEVSHGFIAYRNGDPTAKEAGRLTLNPLRHFDVMGVVMMLLVGLGWAKPVPIDPRNFRRYKRGMVQVSLAGVAANLLIAIFSIAMLVVTQVILKASPVTNAAGYYTANFFVMLFMYSTIVNTGLIAFNLLPICPLDGFRLVETFTSPENGYVRFMRRYGRYIFIALIALGYAADIAHLPIDILGSYLSMIQTGVIKFVELILGAI